MLLACKILCKDCLQLRIKQILIQLNFICLNLVTVSIQEQLTNIIDLRKHNQKAFQSISQEMSLQIKSNFTLGDGLLNDDLDYLDNVRYYPERIQLNSINQLVHSINNEDKQLTIPNNSNQIHIFCSRLTQSNRRGIHIVMKWLTYLHQILKEVRSQRTLELFYQALSRLNIEHSFTCSTDYDRYMKKTLVKPYLQYLMKLATLLTKQTSEQKKKEQQFFTPRSPSKNFAVEKILKSKSKNQNLKFTQQNADSDQNSQKSPIRNRSPISRIRRNTQPSINFYPQECLNQKNNWYQKYNLIQFILQQFYKPINEFSGYFEQFYQFLNNFGILIKEDLKNFYRVVKKQYKSNSNKQIQLISLIQMDNLCEKIQTFMKLGPKLRLQKLLFSELDEQQNYFQVDQQFENFLASSQKIPFLQQLQFNMANQCQKVKNPQLVSKEDTNDSKDSKQNCFIAKNVSLKFS